MANQTRIAISGCCVSRDIFNYLEEEKYSVRKFIQLNPISCIESKTYSGTEIKLDNMTFQSNFIRKCAKHALDGDLIDALLESKADKLIIDLAEERIPKLTLSLDGRKVKIARHVFFKSLTDYFCKDKSKYECKEIKFNGLPWEEVKESYNYFVNRITDRVNGFRQEDIIIVEVYMAKDFVDKDYRICEYDTSNSPFSKEYIKSVNEYLKKCYAYIESLLPNAKVIKIPENVLTAYFHRWGFNPLHYISETSEYLAKCMKICMGNSNENTLDVLYEELKFRNYLSRKVLGIKQENEKN